PYQHKEISVLRAVENRRSVVRAANGGISCLIDPSGKTIAETNMFERTAILVNVPLNNDFTFYTRNPYVVPIICSIISLLIISLYTMKKLSKFLFKEG
ncbi:MAG: apolipoprotein N-acyltransferase, partial [Melioribacteraceae bacterium]|nr:apolipoprotein N-acyltransferase [Melioribacteraceae bacterium]